MAGSSAAMVSGSAPRAYGDSSQYPRKRQADAPAQRTIDGGGKNHAPAVVLLARKVQQHHASPRAVKNLTADAYGERMLFCPSVSKQQR